ncbi:MAG: hypothetical protein CBD18_02390 [Opitutales bacterium TMED158]|nr:MAG: hypothetical protein CBD18_02390 [Opitutales bacterium TMED158]|tara:strand:- start:746 stop:1417 length:672 start_codon:yes stop_codon:yes gene_type:complete
MNIKQAVSTILSKYGLTLEDEVKTEMGEAVLEDGTKVYCSGNFGVGETCYVVNEEGEQIALPDGEYKLQDGATFTIEEGKISASTVKQEEAPAEEKTETKEEEEMVHTPDHKEDEMEDEEKKKMEEDEEEEKKMGHKRYHRRHDMLSKEQAREMLAEVGAELRKEHAAEIKKLKDENSKLVARLEKQEGIKRVAEKKEIPEAVKTYMSSTQASAAQIFNQYSR